MDQHDHGAPGDDRAPNPPAGTPARIGITGIGSALPDHVLTTTDLQAGITAASGLPLPDGLLERATGIRTRRVAADDEYASTLAVRAARRALDDAGLAPADIDLLLFASATRDMAEPATAHVVQDELGTRAHALDVTNACNSFLNGIDLARAFLMVGRGRRALVVVGETPTRVMRRRPRDLAEFRAGFAGYTFGDAGAAVVLEPVARGGILDIAGETRSEHWRLGGIPGGGSRLPRGDEHTWFTGDGQLLRETFEKIGPALLDRARRHAVGEHFTHVLAHQVTMPYLRRFAEIAGVPEDRLVVTVPELGNVAAATIGVQLDRVRERLRTGDRLLLVGLGGGVSIMTAVWEVS
ncbi:3-oxoacyl-ACP synthase III family protein [Streptomyces sp. ST2-7A]|uniref:3-oxoacyl-ACP synthase III family protein n=1 Tax=Streptomyces sp. ST2-7A TaxID=2907214 RepID=UPI001F2DEB31|nr:ketoacyl-ACP synthase III [Streptomyces sp. ST2-7A]MCE7083007.1 ketoacyl-ACP synthase III [Streptomyces sp. ST2-7A]